MKRRNPIAEINLLMRNARNTLGTSMSKHERALRNHQIKTADNILQTIVKPYVDEDVYRIKEAASDARQAMTGFLETCTEHEIQNGFMALRIAVETIDKALGEIPGEATLERWRRDA